MTIQSKFWASTILTIFLVITELGLVALLIGNESQLLRAQKVQTASLQLADELRHSSDELTRTARTYVVTGDVKYRDEYWHILAVRDGKAPRADGRTVPLRALLTAAGISDDELNLLKTAEDNSNALVATEVAAFQAMQGRFMPAGTPLSREDTAYTRTGAPDQAYAIRIMHEDKYHQDKSLIMQPISQFDAALRQRTQLGVDRVTHRSSLLLSWIAGFAVVLILVAAGSHFLVQKPVLRSIRLVTGELADLAKGDFHLDRRLRVDSKDEIGALAGAFNGLLEKLGGIVREVRGQATMVVSRAGEMSDLLVTLQDSIEQQRNSTQSTTAAAHQIAASSTELQRNTGSMADGAQKTSAAVNEGKAGLERIGASVGSLLDGSQQIVAKLSVINNRVGQINAVADAIRRVTDQTNLLSLNAAIEAVKAGEFGMGFSVVANEIRRLADQSADSTVEIEEVLREFRRSVDAGVMEMDRFRGQLNETVAEIETVQQQLAGMISHVQNLLPMLEEFRASFAGQDQGVQQINDAMLALSAKVDATVATLDEARKNRDIVAETGRRLQKLVEQMKI